ncbi:ROK family protein [Salinithrix halophila]|uniref:ROK family protein n=1 Tax=Salinithrix halophila TaxID=1485204 RepID=A0ABV8JAM4_9BACL
MKETGQVTMGVDIGGSKVAAAVIDEKGNRLSRAEMPSIPDDREAMFKRTVECIQEAMDAAHLLPANRAAIGVGVPGKVDRERGIAVIQNNLPWGNFPLLNRLRLFFPAPMVLDNDVVMAAQGEWAIRGADSTQSFIYFTISTGIACCIIEKGRIIRGAGLSGEVGLTFFSGNGGRLEERAAGPAICRWASRKRQAEVTTRETVEAYREKEAWAAAVMEPILDEWARGLYAVFCLVDPHCLVIGGGVIHRHPFLLDEIRSRLATLAIKEQRDLPERVFPAILGGDAGLVGAALAARSSALPDSPHAKGRGGENHGESAGTYRYSSHSTTEDTEKAELRGAKERS